MNEEEKSYHIYRILSGYTMVEVAGVIYIIDTPTPEIMNEAYFYFNKALRQYKFSEMFDLDLARVFLIKEKIWAFDGEKNLEELDKSLDNAKMQLYHAYFLSEKAQNDARRRIQLIREKKNEQLNNKHLIDDKTKYGLATSIKENHIISNIVLNRNYEKINIDDGILLDRINDAYNKELLNHTQYRELARCDEWKSIWNTQGTGAFRAIGTEQLVLSTYSRLYDNVAQHHDCPPRGVIEDDDMLDGWLIFIGQENDNQRNNKATNQNFNTTHKKADEIFIPVHSEADINKVLAMNDTRAKIVQKQLRNTLEKQGTATDLDIPEKVRIYKEKGLKDGK